MTNIRKNYYVDGHEREDVVEYRQKFLDTMKGIEDRMDLFETFETTDSRKKIIFITHDETICYSNDATRMVWRDEDGQGSMRPKGNGKSIMISGFACHCHGFINVNDQKTYTIIHPGKNADGYWTNDDLVKQLNQVMPIFADFHPDAELVFAFDNSQNHHAMAPDTLVATRLNKSDGGKNVPLLRDGWFKDATGEIQIQKMQFEDGKPKGIETILREREVSNLIFNVKVVVKESIAAPGSY